MYYKLKTILSKNQLGLIYIFILLSLITMALELIGLGLIVPFIKSLMSNDSDLIIVKFLNKFDLFPESQTELVIIFITLISAVYTIKTLYLTFFSYAQTKLVADFRVSLSNQIYNIYLNKSFKFHLNNNSSKLIRNIDEVSLVVSLIENIIITISELIVFTGISIFVIWYEPLGAVIIILFFSLFGYFFIKIVNMKVKNWGELRQRYSGLRLKYLNEGFRLIKFAKILQKTKELNKIYTDNNKKLNLYEIKQIFTASLPKLWLEWLIVLAFTVVILVMISLEKDMQYILPIIVLFAAAGFRIMPSLLRIINCLQKIIYNQPALDIIFKEFEKNKNSLHFQKIDRPIISFENKIKLKDIAFRYNESSEFILKNIDLEINQGETIGIIGESGKGKTTLINIILGLMKPSEGKITVDKTDIFESLENWQKKIGYVSQDVFLTDDTIKKNIAFGVNEDEIDEKKIELTLKKANLEDFIKNLDNGINSKIGEFGDRISGGQRQRIAIARALYNNPDILILDEFTNSLDNTTEEKIVNEISNFKEKRTLIIIAHRFSTLKNCDHVYKLENKAIKKVSQLNEN